MRIFIKMDSNYQQLLVTEIIPETTTASTFVLQPLGDWQPEYEAGQFLTLVFNTRHGEKRRSYSISSSPACNEPLSITIKRVENGEFSRMLLSHVKPGDVLITSGISGFFVLPADLSRNDQFFFFAAGSGITPCYALIKTLLKTTNKKLVLIYSNRTEKEAIFLGQLRSLEKQFGGKLQVEFLFSDNIDIYQSRLSSWLMQHLLKKYSPGADALFYLCGPFEYMQMAMISLLSAGIPPDHIRKENFTSFPQLVKSVPPDTALHRVKIFFKGETYHIAVQYPQTILAAAKLKGIRLPYSCEAGSCGSCAATCIKGKVWMARNEVLVDEEIAKGRILCCQAYPIETDAVIVI